jgi:hypothetical protein
MFLNIKNVLKMFLNINFFLILKNINYFFFKHQNFLKMFLNIKIVLKIFETWDEIIH